MNSVSSSNLPTLSYLGYEFGSPVSPFKVEKQFEGSVVLSFSDCASVMLTTAQSGGRLVSTMRDGPPAKYRADVETIFGAETLKSDYALREKVLSLTPASLNLFTPREKLAGNAVMLLLKHVETDRFKDGLYSFQTRWMRGFQEGDVTRDRGIIIEAYDAQDKQAMLIIGNRPGKSCLGQAQLNQIISTLKPVPE